MKRWIVFIMIILTSTFAMADDGKLPVGSMCQGMSENNPWEETFCKVWVSGLQAKEGYRPMVTGETHLAYFVLVKFDGKLSVFVNTVWFPGMLRGVGFSIWSRLGVLSPDEFGKWITDTIEMGEKAFSEWLDYSSPIFREMADQQGSDPGGLYT
jgi:hypothetical protein